MSHSNPGHGETFDEYFGEDGVPAPCVRSGSLFDVQYEVYKRRPHKGSGFSHYTVYVGFPITVCEHDLAARVLPPAPVHGPLNFGPTEDNWVGWGTIDERDYNMTEDGVSLEEDSRMKSKRMFGDDEPMWWSPDTLVAATENWISEALSCVERYECRFCN